MEAYEKVDLAPTRGVSMRCFGYLVCGFAAGFVLSPYVRVSFQWPAGQPQGKGADVVTFPQEEKERRQPFHLVPYRRDPK